MKYEKLIKKVLELNKFEIRTDQVQIINRILETFIHKNIKNIALNAPTGAGKSIIAIIVGECLQALNETGKENSNNYYLSHTNILSKQYEKTFKNNVNSLVVMGANNYDCLIQDNTKADQCLIKSKNKMFFSACEECEYYKIKQKYKSVPNLITNYHFYFISKMFTRQLGDNLLTVFDEAHNINEIFIDFISLKTDSKNLSTIIQKLEYSLQINKVKKIVDNKGTIEYSVSQLKSLLNKLDLIKKENSALFFYQKASIKYIELLFSIYKTLTIIADAYNLYSELHYDQELEIEHNKDLVIFEKVRQLSNHYNHFISVGYKLLEKDKNSFIFDIENSSISLLPVFIRDYFSSISNSKYNLFMSATINKEFIQETLKLDSATTAAINAKNTFNKTDKNIMFLNYDNLNHSRLKLDKTYNDINNSIKKILQPHKKDNGIIITSTFDMAEKIYNGIQYIDSHKIFIHNKGENLKDVFSEYKKYYHNSKILISPSIYEGVDMKGELSTFQIMIKAPYPSLKSKRWRYILNNYNNIYQQYTLFKIIQGFGRSTRFKGDQSITYCIDTNLSNSFHSYNNIWVNQFNVI